MVETDGRSFGVPVGGGQIDLADEVVTGRGGRQHGKYLVLEFLRLKHFFKVTPDERPVGKQLRRVGVDGTLNLLVEPSNACARELRRLPLIFFAGAGRGIPQIDAEGLHGVVEGNLLIRWEPEICGIGGPCDSQGMCLTVPKDEVANEGCVHQLLSRRNVRDPFPLSHHLRLPLCRDGEGGGKLICAHEVIEDWHAING